VLELEAAEVRARPFHDAVAAAADHVRAALPASIALGERWEDLQCLVQAVAQALPASSAFSLPILSFTVKDDASFSIVQVFFEWGKENNNNNNNLS
jgi:hypothetical protein